MGQHNADTAVMDRFLVALKERGAVFHNPQRSGSVLYLKCWGSDYPYLQGVEEQKRLLPAVVPSATKSPRQRRASLASGSDSRKAARGQR